MFREIEIGFDINLASQKYDPKAFINSDSLNPVIPQIVFPSRHTIKNRKTRNFNSQFFIINYF